MATNGDDAIGGHPVFDTDEKFVGNANGLTKREHFAGQILVGFCANSGISEALGEMDMHGPTALAQMAVVQADALIEELNKEK